MARKIKIPNEHLKRYARQEQKRKLNVRTKRIEDAIRNAKKLESNCIGRLDYANHNPCTMVYRLVEELFKLN